MVGSAALELATSFDVGYKNKCILHHGKEKKLCKFVIIKSIDIIYL